MNDFWTTAVKVGGVISVGLFVFWSLAKDMIPNFSTLNSFQTLVLAGFMLFLVFLIILKLIKKETPIVNNDLKNQPNNERNSSVIINGDNSNGNIVTGDGNSINSNNEPTSNKENSNRDSSVNIGGSNSGNVVTGDGNNIG